MEWDVKPYSTQLSLEKIKCRAKNLVNGFQNLTYDLCLKRLGLTTLERRRESGDLIEAFKILADREKVDKCDLFEQSKSVYNLRAHEHTISVKRNRTTTRSPFVSQ